MRVCSPQLSNSFTAEASLEKGVLAGCLWLSIMEDRILGVLSGVCLNCGRAEVGQQLVLLSANPESNPLIPWGD